jgi:hypothetical protein
MNRPIFVTSTSFLAILAIAIAIPVRSQLPSASPQSTMSPQPTISPSPQSTMSPQPTISPSVTPSLPSGGNIISKLQCGSKATATGEISLRANGYYTAKDENGKYQAINQGYRFLSGSLRGQSMVQYKRNTYLIDSKDEPKASALIANNSAETIACSNILRTR